MARLMATATCTAFRGTLEGSGERVGQRVLLERVCFLARLSRSLTGALVAARWDEESLDVLAAGVDERGETLPSKGWMAMRRLNWPRTVTAPAGVYVPDRVRRGVEEYAARTLRLALHRRTIVTAVLATWPADPRRRTEGEWAALRAVLPAGVSGAEIRNRTRQIRAYLSAHGKLPAGLCVLEGPPQVAPLVVLAAMDRQQVTLARVDAVTARLRVKLPLRAAPASGRDWAWHVIDIHLPAAVAPGAVLHTPTLRPTPAGRIAVDLPHSRPAPATKATGHRVGLGFDWGVNTLLTGVLGRLTGRGPAQRVVTDGRPLVFDATTVSASLHRLRGHREHLAAKRDHYRALADGLGSPHPAWGEHLDRARVLETEHGRVCARIRHLNQALARAAARWAVDQAVALGASVIYLEDLATLEARGHRRGNARLSGQVRGTVAEAMRHLGARAGIVVVTVPARGTSKLCPGCLNTLTHHPAPDRLSERGWKWAHCARCGLSMDRDHAAARRIVSRGLLAQAHTVTDRTTHTRTIRTTIDATVALVRRPKKTTRRLRRQRRAETAPPRPRGPKTNPGKQRPTPSRPAAPRGRGTRRTAGQAPGHKTSRRMPDVRTVPATTPTTGAVQRPAGHDTQAPAAVSGPVPGHGVPAPHRPEEHLLPAGRMRLSNRTCRRRTRAAERTGFHHLHATQVHPLTPRIGPHTGDRTRPRRARKAWKPQAHTEF
ncbi:zinc ribbon domain-containing protein [Streptomyces sp. NBC_00365]|uniref:zinc ribbon domain-containing protein n=1 Tax=Streptomyces sp. NBC_00365 TaxID=2975726 RepID=UPI002257555D|nr:zinc ribbon domain-containing protein [Streptomyces sp. NBC_00365]MCX5087384.1 zinc ribbon domain-containing protein [Streptomyces sp. NBC_00365]MCX5096249.1 zinc ribbon domain-containing protein [Streptomyces sp. NBC_00365]MCX5097960.1 zinc ribbon domain-containing protein [Streptomyces sp. NBC_00365]